MPYENGQYVQPTKTVTEPIEEWVSDTVPDDYDWAGDMSSGINPACLAQRKSLFDKCIKGETRATNDGGWPRGGWGEVLAVGMASKWPHWRPRPTVSVGSRMSGCQWIDWLSLTDVAPLAQREKRP